MAKKKQEEERKAEKKFLLKLFVSMIRSRLLIMFVVLNRRRKRKSIEFRYASIIKSEKKKFTRVLFIHNIEKDRITRIRRLEKDQAAFKVQNKMKKKRMLIDHCGDADAHS